MARIFRSFPVYRPLSRPRTSVFVTPNLNNSVIQFTQRRRLPAHNYVHRVTVISPAATSSRRRFGIVI